MGQHAPEVLIGRLLEQPGGDIELAPSGAGRVDVSIVHNPNPNLIQGARMIHGRDERGHDAADTLGLLRIERVGRGLGFASLCGLRSGRRRARYPGATRCQEDEENGSNAVCAHHLVKAHTRTARSGT